MSKYLHDVFKAKDFDMIFYSYTPFTNSRINNSFGELSLWIAQYPRAFNVDTSKPNLPKAWTDWVIWQYVKGVKQRMVVMC